MSEHSTSTAGMSAEEIRVEMKRRFDAANEQVERKHQMWEDYEDSLEATEDKAPPALAPDVSNHSPEVGENDAQGG
jgi:hypothetical protein